MRLREPNPRDPSPDAIKLRLQTKLSDPQSRRARRLQLRIFPLLRDGTTKPLLLQLHDPWPYQHVARSRSRSLALPPDEVFRFKARQFHLQFRLRRVWESSRDRGR
ncbi:BnaAnng22900D [Brassica napus]|uniref:BnaAnng22900D protein n=1 Tax=Brassica napus TaxID=3708 RepID=A0A078JLY6_BRANA|nr:BnaAnng22900D [Brassica napus]